MVKFDRFEFLCLSGVYAIMWMYASYRLAQIHSRIPKKWTFQKKTMCLVAACAFCKHSLRARTHTHNHTHTHTFQLEQYCLL